MNATGGQTFYKDLILYNKGKIGTYIKVWVEDFLIDSLTGVPQGAPLFSTPYSCAEWIKIKESFFYLKKGEEKKINISITPPVEASGSYIALIVFGTCDKSGDTRKFGIEVTSSILLKVNAGNLKPQIKLKKMNIYEKNGEFFIDFKVENITNIYTRVKEVLQIKDAKGKLIEEFKNENHTFFPPFSKRIYKYKIKNKLKGKYTAILFIEYDESYEVFEKPFFIK